MMEIMERVLSVRILSFVTLLGLSIAIWTTDPQIREAAVLFSIASFLFLFGALFNEAGQRGWESADRMIRRHEDIRRRRRQNIQS
ncbi:MAG: hypothetical protein AAB367_03390 [Patescibacteria group bacterium]